MPTKPPSGDGDRKWEMSAEMSAAVRAGWDGSASAEPGAPQN